MPLDHAAPSAPSAGPAVAGTVGPNAIIQLARALRDAAGEAAAARILAAAGEAEALERPPEAMVDQARAARLFTATLDDLGPQRGERILAEAGRRTADYILANRIPPLARRCLPLAPVPLARRVLLSAIRASAWTFAGSGAVRVGMRPAPWIEIEANPLATPGCPWHGAVFQRLFEVLAPGRGGVWRYRRGRAARAPVCRFAFEASR
ncbi:MAG: bacteriochlorophyll 4-vinyl reductase [Pseudomonadota bacterium]